MNHQRKSTTALQEKVALANRLVVQRYIELVQSTATNDTLRQADHDAALEALDNLSWLAAYDELTITNP